VMRTMPVGARNVDDAPRAAANRAAVLVAPAEVVPLPGVPVAGVPAAGPGLAAAVEVVLTLTLWEPERGLPPLERAANGRPTILPPEMPRIARATLASRGRVDTVAALWTARPGSVLVTSSKVAGGRSAAAIARAISTSLPRVVGSSPNRFSVVSTRTAPAITVAASSHSCTAGGVAGTRLVVRSS